GRPRKRRQPAAETIPGQPQTDQAQGLLVSHAARLAPWPIPTRDGQSEAHSAVKRPPCGGIAPETHAVRKPAWPAQDRCESALLTHGLRVTLEFPVGAAKRIATGR